jgi:hypothetical protein
MAYKAFWLCLLLVAFSIPGCGKPQPVKKAEAAEKKPVGAWRPGEKVTYQWPADFKLPLVIIMETPEVPKEIQGPSPPIKADQKKPAEQRSRKFPWFF